MALHLAQTSWPSVPSDFGSVGVLMLVAVGLTAAIIVLTHLLGPRRSGPVKHSPYESGMDPIGDARRQFQVRFYLIAVMYLVFAVEIVFLYPWAVLLPRLHGNESAAEALPTTELAAAGYTPGFMLAAGGVFLILLVVGLIYEWRRGVFKWN
jgi:NADH-quinone oxidoreductase subunit A